MANQQAHIAMQNKGTLVPGQSIVVNKFTVQVERYLSQGGFAHVYLVRTATPVYNTTHHVLKRIAVANETMLGEVKKEVDVMRLLKGHPNIVHLIDAAWHQMSNGMYEVFILMEFCPGGGIIDMMNRRLRERLTEAEILQIFVDVCEGVACMHNLRPALLHRDLKVENILQSTPTSYKLCDFGSATTVSRPPTTTQEIRTLEADLNRHTTLQYRAPEMVDVYSRKPVDEKSDVWALGVLLYKLCYYTTPFEEHGQLAILNVQYKIPPYPVYSPQMNGLIASMLQEHGVRRPSVFEVLTHVHRLRGTKSRFKYTIPAPQPLSPHLQTSFKPSFSSAAGRNELMSAPQPSRVAMSVSPSRGQATPLQQLSQTDSKETGAPLSSSNPQKPPDMQPIRRGRPPAKESDKIPPKAASQAGNDWLEGGFSTGGDLWASVSTSSNDNAMAAAWRVEGKSPRSGESKDANIGFGDNFASKLWDKAVADKSQSPAHLTPTSSKPSSPLPSRSQQPLGINRRPSPNKDAFDGLGLMLAEKPAPTLAEARKLRTGLAIMHSNGFRTNPDRSAPKPSPSPRQTLSPHSQLYPSSVATLTPEFSKMPSPRLSPHSAPSLHSQPDSISAENRFPSLEELDSGISVPLTSSSFTGVTSRQGPEDSVSLTRRNAGLLKPGSHPRGYHAREGTRSEQTTGVAMWNSETDTGRLSDKASLDQAPRDKKPTGGELPAHNERSSYLRPSLPSKSKGFTSSNDTPATIHLSPGTVQDPVPRSPRHKTFKDWLTGDNEGDDSLGGSSTSLLYTPARDETPVLRESPSKRASLVESSPIPIQSAVVAQHDHTRHSPSPTLSPTLSKFTRSFPPIDGLEDSKPPPLPLKRSPVSKRTSTRLLDDANASSGDEGPEDAEGIIRQTRKTQPERKGHKGRQSSVHDLVDLYGGGFALKERESHTAQPSNSGLDFKGLAQNGHLTETTAKPPKSHPTTSVAPNTALQAPLSTITRGSSGIREQYTPSASSSTPAPTPSPRSRPQSMFLFPSKSTESYSISADQAPPSPRLVPPSDEVKNRPVRRTSISDIVQRYEGISGANKPTSTNVVSPTTPRTSVKLPGLASTDTHSPKKPHPAEKERVGPGFLVPVGDYVPNRQSKSPKEPSFSSSPILAIGRSVPIRHEPDSPSVTSLKPEPIRIAKFPSGSTNAEGPSTRNENNSSSPERPYQGVGKLIDQWQKKTAEAESPRTVLRGRGTLASKPG